MKKAITFELSGRTGFFKKPDVNVNTYFTYNNVHKVALLGILGAIIGLGGHIQQNREIEIDNKFPEFYEKLHNLKIAIEPKGKNGYFIKKIQVFNNSVGYASKEEGGNLIVKEQWLENPRWQIYLLDDDSIERDVFDRLKDYLINNKCTFMPYLGKNDHPANIEEVSIIEIKSVKDIERIDTLFREDDVEIGDFPYDPDENPFFFREYSPCRLEEKYNFYEFEKLCFTNLEILDKKKVDNVYSFKYGKGEKVLTFF
ncbi:type I-B CRISPR-associated protein Cas5b [Sporanaerobacter acetigenes]|uniref:type I-B CRISPR-associated protein Cas5b n=1 Tax=Sporanaerobacter acetigenes TaxID=165813 RepID=UPI00104BD4CC|nr:type I-B CRISPR-associated protein Cas5b [Sporanaerobacter acetigenes]